MSVTTRKLALYSVAHFWVDFSCALLLFGVLAGKPSFILCLLIYNFCAFALQMPLGLLASQLNRNGLTAASGCVLTALAYLLPLPLWIAVTAGVGNALFHLGGGIDILNNSEKQAAALGVFVSPGAVGLYAGTLLGKTASPPLWVGPLGLLALAAVMLARLRRPSGNPPLSLSCSYKPLLPLFLVVVLRSYMGMNQSFSWKGSGPWALVLTLALALGKAAGGFAMDFLGPRRAAAWSLGAAAAQALPEAKGFTFGLLTFGLFLGFLPSCLGWPSLLSGAWSYAALTLASLALLWTALRWEAAEC